MTRKITLGLTAACVAAAMSVPAHAAIQTGANGNLMFAVWDTKGTADTADDSSYVRDLGKTLNDFATAATVSAIQTGQTAGVPSVVGPSVLLEFTPDALFSSWFGSVSSVSNLVWNVAAGDSAGDKRLLTTATDGTVPAISNFNFTAVVGAYDVFAAQSNALGTHPTTTDGSNTATAADGPALASGLTWGTNFANSAGWNNAGTVGESLDFFLLDQNGTASGNNVLVTQFAFARDMTWTLRNDGTLVYTAAPIPEPGTYALMALGMLAVAGVARRSTKK
jgi:hypothetical protein